MKPWRALVVKQETSTSLVLQDSRYDSVLFMQSFWGGCTLGKCACLWSRSGPKLGRSRSSMKWQDLDASFYFHRRSFSQGRIRDYCKKWMSHPIDWLHTSSHSQRTANIVWHVAIILLVHVENTKFYPRILHKCVTKAFTHIRRWKLVKFPALQFLQILDHKGCVFRELNSLTSFHFH